MTLDDLPAPELMCEGKFVRLLKRGRWEYASRARNINAVVVLAEHDGKMILIEQYRVPVGARCLELPAGLVGDEDAHATVEGTAVKELEEETGFTCERVERLGEFHSSPGMVAESFTLVRAQGIRKVGEGGGNEHEDITVHLVARDDIPAFVKSRRDAGCAIDVKLLLFARF
jgi:ADP-ribose pyrophosphatase